MFLILAVIAVIWAMSRVADKDYQQAGALLAIAVACGIVGFVLERDEGG
jgi:hypothetical protein